MTDRPGLSQIELSWFIAWIIADGDWGGVDLEQEGGRKLLLQFFGYLEDKPLEAAQQARIRLQQCLMALRRGTFEEIQRESPFSRYAEGNMESLLQAWMEEHESGFTRKWSEIFR